jgi:hypothetical protein
MIINLKYKKDLITIDLRIKQIRYLTDYKNKKGIDFINLSDTSLYDYLIKEYQNKNLRIIFSILTFQLKEDIKLYLNKEIDLRKLKVLK